MFRIFDFFQMLIYPLTLKVLIIQMAGGTMLAYKIMLWAAIPTTSPTGSPWPATSPSLCPLPQETTAPAMPWERRPLPCTAVSIAHIMNGSFCVRSRYEIMLFQATHCFLDRIHS